MAQKLETCGKIAGEAHRRESREEGGMREEFHWLVFMVLMTVREAFCLDGDPTLYFERYPKLPTCKEWGGL